jgi:chitin synthase
MMIYLVALPVWNFVLPVYSFWHFDDFSWGETRKVEGEVVDKAGHGAEEVEFAGTTIPLRRWDDWERSRLRKLRREEKRRRQMEKMHGRGFYGEDGDNLAAPGRGFARDYDSDCGSVVSSEEDVWGAEIGGYDENNPAYPPPPTTVAPENSAMRGPTQTLGVNDMATLLDQGFDEPPPAQTRPDRNAPSPLQRGFTPVQQRSPTGSGSGKSSPVGYAPEQYAALSRNSPISAGYAQSTAVESYGGNGHTRQRSGGGANVGLLSGKSSGDSSGKYGPLGPLDDDSINGNGYGKRL